MLKVMTFIMEKNVDGYLYGRAEISVDDASELATSNGTWVKQGAST